MQNRFFGFHLAGMPVFEQKISKQYWYLISHRKNYNHFCRPTPSSLKNGHAPPKLFFAVILGNHFFFEKTVK